MTATGSHTDITSRDWLNAFAAGARDLPLPITLQLQVADKQIPLLVDKSFRLLPGKRVTLRSTLDGKPIVIKLFRKNASSARHIASEKNGCARVTQAGIACPPLLGEFTTACGGFDGVIYGFIDNAGELSQRWPQFDQHEKQFWIEKMMQLLATLHNAGAWQSDIHAGNFLLRDQQLVLLDLGSVVIENAALTPQQAMNNLGQLVAQFDIADQALVEDCVKHYCEFQQWDFNALRSTLREKIRAAWKDRLRDYLGKAQRDCTLTHFEQSWSRVFACRRTWQGDDMQRFALDPNAFMHNAQMLKAGNSATVVRTTINGKPVVIKRYNIKNFSHALRRSLQPTRAQHSWHYAHLLEIAGIASLKPVAWLEQRRGPLRSTAWFVCEWIGAPDLLDIGNQRALADDEYAALATLLQTMQQLQLSHGDFKANNLMLQRDERGSRVALIDLDAMRAHNNERKFRRAFADDLARLARNWPAEKPIAAQIQTLLQSLDLR